MRPRRRDLLLAAACAVVQVAGAYAVGRHHGGARGLDPLGVALLLAGPTVLLVRRRSPDAVLGFVLVALAAYWGLGYPQGPTFVAFLAALVSAVLRGRRATALAAVGLLAVAIVLGALLSADRDLAPALPGVGWPLALVLGTDHLRTRRAAAADARRAREEEERRRAGEERLRVARELHDVLAHSISLINVRAGVALHLLDEQPEQARDALVTIKQASADGLRDLRRTLGVLREDPSLRPTPGLSELDRLVDGARDAGLEVATEVRGTPRPVDAPVGLAAYRVVQEALTNVSRHAGTPHARVLVAYGADALEVRVDDDGPGRSGTGGGHGLGGMAERAAALGGTFEAGARPDGGFSVHVRLPVSAP